ncbi:hypothetical protein BDN72DRAFT_850040 [Pluteus cervinus]|uniref:Uncharacterized protein n=1 Tax=Pluteus cervinus TaxID=181527 RepID=A0ACD3A5A4_9AGAR|nr:hypothetical protein BDN72DRAFT_850040 [Pluteus cervinus]
MDTHPNPPIVHLPGEILTTVFSLLPPRSVVGLTHVCRRWRQLAISYPSLWSVISLGEPSESVDFSVLPNFSMALSDSSLHDLASNSWSPQNLSPDLIELFRANPGFFVQLHMLDEYLTRSKQLPLEFHLSQCLDLDGFDYYVDALVAHLTRWRTAFIQVEDNDGLQKLRECFGLGSGSPRGLNSVASLPSLETLSIDIQIGRDLEGRVPMLQVYARRVPSLTCLVLSNDAIRCYVNPFLPSSITTLYLDCILSLHHSLQLTHQALRSVLSLPLLETLSIHGTFFPAVISPQNDVTPITMGRLKYFRYLGSQAGFRYLVQLMETPELRFICLVGISLAYLSRHESFNTSKERGLFATVTELILFNCHFNADEQFATLFSWAPNVQQLGIAGRYTLKRFAEALKASLVPAPAAGLSVPTNSKPQIFRNLESVWFKVDKDFKLIFQEFILHRLRGGWLPKLSVSDPLEGDLQAVDGLGVEVRRWDHIHEWSPFQSLVIPGSKLGTENANFWGRINI